MNIAQGSFYVFGFVAVAAAVFMLATRNVLYAAFGLLITLLSVAAIFVLLFADFLAVSQIMVYVGGVLVLILFGVMLSNRVQDRALESETMNRYSGLLVAVLLFAGLAYLIQTGDWALPVAQGAAGELSGTAKSSISAIGMRLITNFALPFEVTSFILLLALIGAAYISTEDKHG
ncbi:MAG: NADH-quinone oxidoreductase subunit J [Adhaeribacter sp.]